MSERKKILLIEDEGHIAQGLAFNLRKLGHEVEIASDGKQGLERWAQGGHDLIVLDLMLPIIEGQEILKRIRQSDKETPVIILSARDRPQDKVEGLSLGAFDYLTKPFHLDEFLLRVTGLLKRHSHHPAEEEQKLFSFGPHQVDFKNNVAHSQGKDIELTEQEKKLLRFFTQRPNESLGREELLKAVWGYSEGVESRTIDNFIVRLRKYFEKDPRIPRFFTSQRGKGYRFDPEGKE